MSEFEAGLSETARSYLREGKCDESSVVRQTPRINGRAPPMLFDSRS
ncbi:hypothetical protein [Bradyrhizobium sp. Leo170]|nr:hypothetical protein [Bradyrhizobium sp. Leo170]